jgi:hypothetical protein
MFICLIFYRINLFGDTGFRSSIISLNSESEICIILSLTFELQMGKRLARRYQSKVALHSRVLLSKLLFPFGRLAR